MSVPPWWLPSETTGPTDSRPLTENEADIVDVISKNKHFRKIVDRTILSLQPGSTFAVIRQRIREATTELSKEGFFPWTPSTIILSVIADAFLERELSLQKNEWQIANSYLIGLYSEPDWYLDRVHFNPNNPVFMRLKAHNFIDIVSWSAVITHEGKQFLETFWFVDEQGKITIEGDFRLEQAAGLIGQS